ncbi:hypothetical protein AB0758_43800 [Tolypothrix bouteillei VB521301_2]|uniref:hypothetical protein n=1 Tax=Tolypothrix bouteillei TaxID=1246981 RepID=UPI0038B5DE8C
MGYVGSQTFEQYVVRRSRSLSIGNLCNAPDKFLLYVAPGVLKLRFKESIAQEP